MKEAVTVILNRIAEAVPVKWDRLIDAPPTLSVYGWIERRCSDCPKGYIVTDCETCNGTGVDRRADFILVRAEREGALFMTYFTSSSEHSEAIAVAIWGEAAEDVHIECERVEDVLPGIEVAIKL